MATSEDCSLGTRQRYWTDAATLSIEHSELVDGCAEGCVRSVVDSVYMGVSGAGEGA